MYSTHFEPLQMTYRSILLSCCNINAILYQSVLLSAVVLEPSHVVALTHSTIQNGGTALEEASIRGHHNIVEILLGAGANPNLMDTVSTGQNGTHALILVSILSTCLACF